MHPTYNVQMNIKCTVMLYPFHIQLCISRQFFF